MPDAARRAVSTAEDILEPRVGEGEPLKRTPPQDSGSLRVGRGVRARVEVAELPRGLEEVREGIDGMNMPDALEVVKNFRVQFGNNFTKFEWFKPEQLRLVK
jgi:hypothetical protein